MKTEQILTCILCTIFVLSLCGCSYHGDMNSTSEWSMVEDVFTQIPQTPSETTATTDYDFPQLEAPRGINHGFVGDKKFDEIGVYFTYSGGEMHMDYWLQCDGFSTTGVGILLFIDGMPQPYKTADDDAYSYMHIFYPPNGQEMYYELIFTPTTGQMGDMLEISSMNINFPTYDHMQGRYSMAHTNGAFAITTRLKYEATPDTVVFPQVPDRVLTVNTYNLDLMPEEIEHWSDEDLLTNIEAHIYINDDFECKSTSYWGVAADAPLKVQVEMWGCPYAEYGLVLFVENEPVHLDTPNVLTIRTNAGQKVVVQIELDIINSDGEVVVYGMLVPKNMYSIGYDNNCDTKVLQTFYIFSANNFDEYYWTNRCG